MNSRLLLVFLCGCLSDLELDQKNFACRDPADCVDGFVCDPQRFVCVRPGSDGGVVVTTDGGNVLPKIGEACPNGSCGEGTCVDGVCCSTPCTEACHRCDLTPGTCTLAADGTD